MQDQAGPVGMFGDGLAHFHAVSRSLATHWYHVSLKRRHDERFMAYEEMVSDEPRLVELLISQDESMVIKEVQVVTPAWMNKGSSWKMEKLTSLSIADVGSAVGYENQLHFSRAFKNIYGVAPREWRNEHK